MCNLFSNPTDFQNPSGLNLPLSLTNGNNKTTSINNYAYFAKYKMIAINDNTNTLIHRKILYLKIL